MLHALSSGMLHHQCRSLGHQAVNVHRAQCQEMRTLFEYGLSDLQVFLTPTHLGIVMEYAAGGELFDRIVKAGRFSEDEARFFFQQLISGVDYCHSEVSCHLRPTPMHLKQALCLYKLTAFPSVPVLCFMALWLTVLFGMLTVV